MGYAMASYFSALLAMSASTRAPINPLRRPPLAAGAGHHPPLPMLLPLLHA
jgi:hypothetical protein